MDGNLHVSSRWRALAQVRTWPDIFEDTANRYPDNEALVFRETGQRYTYREYREEVHKVARGLCALGVRKGTHVGIWMTNRPEWCFLRWAIYKLGAIMVPIHSRNKTEELSYVLKQGDVEVLVLEEKFVGQVNAIGMLLELLPDLARQPAGKTSAANFPSLRTIVCLGGQRYPGTYTFDEAIQKGGSIDLEARAAKVISEDVIHIIYTSGTTGFPKGVVTLSSCNLAFCAISAELYEMSATARYLNLMPFSGNIGLWNLALPVFDGATLVDGGSVFDPSGTLKTIQEEEITHAIFVPTMLLDVLDVPDFPHGDNLSLKRITCSGAPVPQTLIKSAKKKLGVSLMNVYGLSEASGLSTWVPYGDTPEHVEKSVGLAMPHCEVAILDLRTGERCPAGVEGEICTREVFPGSQHMKGYYKQPDLTREILREGWLHSGDLGKMDEDRYVYLTGRLKEMFTVGGFNVSPAEVENFLLKHPKVANVAVVGVPDDRLGEIGAAFVKLKEGAAANESEILEFCKGKIAGMKIPQYVFFIENFPLNPQGKVQKFKLKERYANRL
ncbi:MAG: AMP-binding protein [Betaproteobacteria bacterium]|nr:AMP-binding protein [Betaproteobacteria bacterium]